jgi:hypothetical protein
VTKAFRVAGVDRLYASVLPAYRATRAGPTAVAGRPVCRRTIDRRERKNVKKGLSGSRFEAALAVTEGQRVSLVTLCAAPELDLLAQRVDSVPTDLAAPWHRGGGSDSTLQWRGRPPRSGPSQHTTASSSTLHTCWLFYACPCHPTQHDTLGADTEGGEESSARWICTFASSSSLYTAYLPN